MRFLIVSAVVASVCADADPQLLLGGAALPYAVGSAVVATPPASPASTVKTAPVIATAPVPAIGYAGLGYAGLGQVGLGYAGLGYAGLGHAGLGYAGLGYAGLGHASLGLYGRKKRDADAGLLLANDGANALPIITIPAHATAGYAPGASGALGGQAPVAAPAAVAPVASAAIPASVGYAGLGYAGLGYAGLGYAGLGHAGLGYAGLGYAGLGYASGYANVSPSAATSIAGLAPAAAPGLVGGYAAAGRYCANSAGVVHCA